MPAVSVKVRFRPRIPYRSWSCSALVPVGTYHSMLYDDVPLDQSWVAGRRERSPVWQAAQAQCLMTFGPIKESRMAVGDFGLRKYGGCVWNRGVRASRAGMIRWPTWSSCTLTEVLESGRRTWRTHPGSE